MYKYSVELIYQIIDNFNYLLITLIMDQIYNLQ